MARFRNVPQWVLLLLALPAILCAQSASTALSGRVVDEDGAVVPHAVISITDETRAIRRETTTGLEGLFVFDQLPPSSYTVRVEKEGFAAIEFENVTLNVSDRRSLGDVRLTQREAPIKINVVAALPDSPAVSAVVDRRFMENQPLSGRSFQRLIE